MTAALRWLSLPLLAATLLLFSPAKAEAGVLITRGDTIGELGAISPELLKAADLPGNLKVGYKYSYFGVFWLDFWTYDGEFCLYTTKEEGYNPIEASVAAKLLNISEDQLKAPFLYRFPLGLWIIIGFGGLFVLSIAVSAVIGKKEDLGDVTPTPSADPDHVGGEGADDADDEDDEDFYRSTAKASNPDLSAPAPSAPAPSPAAMSSAPDISLAAPAPVGPSSPSASAPVGPSSPSAPAPVGPSSPSDPNS
jgi:hypothetical protein